MFGRHRAFKPLTLAEDGALRDDKYCLQCGFLHLTNQKDKFGHGIVIVSLSNIPLDTSYDRKSMSRALWYIIHAMVEDEEVQRKGVVVLRAMRQSQASQFDRSLVRMFLPILRKYMPMRIVGIHDLNPPPIYRLFVNVYIFFAGEGARRLIRAHVGSDEQIVETLERDFGIERSKIPEETGGNLRLDHKEWLEERRAAGL